MKTIETIVEIDAQPEEVWKILTDFPSYPDWNPFIRSIEGPIEAGKRLSIIVQPPGSRATRFRPRVLVAAAGRDLRWKGRLFFPGLFDGEHYFRLFTEGGRTSLEHGERFTGLVPRLMPASSLAAIRAGFEAMNQALKSRAEG